MASNLKTVLDLKRKIVAAESLAEWRGSFDGTGKRLVVTNGCFDLLHPGHVLYLEQARNLGGALLVGVNGDAGVRILKGEGRPINNELDRALVLAALQSVDFVSIFPEVRATAFLQQVRPHLYIKGGDYNVETLDQDERRAVENSGGSISIIQFVAGKSTTRLVEKIAGSRP